MNVFGDITVCLQFAPLLYKFDKASQVMAHELAMFPCSNISLGTIINYNDCCCIGRTWLARRLQDVCNRGRKFLVPEVVWSYHEVIFGLFCSYSLDYCQLPFYNAMHTKWWLFFVRLAWNPVRKGHKGQCLAGRPQLAREAAASGSIIGAQNIAKLRFGLVATRPIIRRIISIHCDCRVDTDLALTV